MGKVTRELSHCNAVTREGGEPLLEFSMSNPNPFVRAPGFNKNLRHETVAEIYVVGIEFQLVLPYVGRRANLQFLF